MASLYLPLIGIVVEALPQLYDPNIELRGRNAQQQEGEVQGITQNVAMAIASSSVYGSPPATSPVANAENYEPSQRVSLI